MLKIRYVFIVLGMLLNSAAYPAAQVSIGIGFPNVSIGINLPVYPDLVVVPGYPVYYAPQLEANFFFYDGLYWVYQDDSWYASSWYNGPWWFVDYEVVPVFILRIPVRYYRRPPVYFRGWRSDAPPRWGDHWGHDWEQRRGGWDRWDRGAVPRPAPLPVYQRQYSGDRYPRQEEQQKDIHKQQYRYQPSDPEVRQHYQNRVERQQEKREASDERGSRQQDMQRSAPRQQESRQPGKDATRKQKPGQEQRQERNRDQDRDQDRERDRDRRN